MPRPAKIKDSKKVVTKKDGKTETQVKEERIRPQAVTIAPATEALPRAILAKKKQLKWIGPWSYGKISMIGAAIFGLVYGLFLAIFMPIVEKMSTTKSSEFALYKALGWWVILVMPVVYGILGLLFGMLGAAIYNLLAKWAGGIEVTIE
jgi:hypothetical protein